MSNLPSYLLVIIALFVVLPSLVTVFLRFFLYRNLSQQIYKLQRLVNDESTTKPTIINALEYRFKIAGNKLENINTLALIEQVYNQKKIGGIRRDQIDYFCRILPNLLLAFGLLGTFWGITVNLTALSQTLSNINATDVNSLVKELQTPLQGMGIAFITSLTGLFFSMILTLTNFVWNTGLAKIRLFSLLEDYLDNVYHAELQGDTRLDRTMEKMADRFDNFLTRFGEVVKGGVESALRDKIEEIMEANLKAANLAQEVYGRLADASGTIARSADQFQLIVGEFQRASDSFNQSQFPDKLSNFIINLDGTQNNFAHASNFLIAGIKSLETTCRELQQEVQKFGELTKDLSIINQVSTKVFELQQGNQDTLQELIPKLQGNQDTLQELIPKLQTNQDLMQTTITEIYQGAKEFNAASNTLEMLEQKLAVKADILAEIPELLERLIANVKNHEERLNLGMEAMTDRLLENLDNKGDDGMLTGEKMEFLAEQISQLNQYLNQSKYELNKCREILEKLWQKIEWGDGPAVDDLRKRLRKI